MNILTVSRTVSSNCRAEAARHGKDAQDTANGIGMHRATLSRRLSGQSAFTIDELAAVAQFLGVPLSALLVGVDATAAA